MSKVTLKVGRVAEVTRANVALKLKVGTWTALIHIKEKDADGAAAASKGALSYECMTEAYGSMWVKTDACRMHTDVYGSIQMHTDTYGYIWMHMDA